ncbi:MAG: hypothetical protein WAW37_17275 [Syntrophobacteraceae bacterium]
MSERLILKGALQDKKLERMRLAARAQGLITAIKQIVQPASVVPLKDLRTDEAFELIAELHRLRGLYLPLCAEIEEIERELD